MAPVALSWKQQQFGDAGWMQEGGGQSRALCRSCSPNSAAVLGAKIHKTWGKDTQNTLLGCGTHESCEDAAKDGQVPSNHQCPTSHATHAG